MIYFYIIIAVAIILLAAVHYILKYFMPAKTRGEYLIDIMKEKDEELYGIMDNISKELECSLESVVFTHYALVKDTEDTNDAETACENFIILVNDIYSNPKKGFLSLELRSSEDLTSIARKLSSEKIVNIPKGFTFAGLDEVFEKIN
ncbi:MAG: hypothetical protein NE328_19755 [Lentisphaeraceae bacterium]|nr:hypothetical protein [Lentisphaeraceae bacterium]